MITNARGVILVSVCFKVPICSLYEIIAYNENIGYQPIWGLFVTLNVWIITQVDNWRPRADLNFTKTGLMSNCGKKKKKNAINMSLKQLYKHQ